jgi:hypothetical protein
VIINVDSGLNIQFEDGRAYLVISVIMKSVREVNNNEHGTEREVCKERRKNIAVVSS